MNDTSSSKAQTQRKIKEKMERMENPGMKKETRKRRAETGEGGTELVRLMGRGEEGGNKVDTGLKDKKLKPAKVLGRECRVT